ncbi:MAG: hypothetical protein QNJ16_18290 [Rhodobacter sp.]|nr:hypothetical protein [Rhodobacter sp.]
MGIRYRLLSDGSVNMKDSRTGEPFNVPESEAKRLMDNGEATPLSEAERSRALEAIEYDSPVKAFGAGAVNAALLGIPALAVPDEFGKLSKHNPTAYGGGEAAGAIGSLLVPGAPLARVAAKGASLGAKAAARLTRAERIAQAMKSKGFAAGADATGFALGKASPHVVKAAKAARKARGAPGGGAWHSSPLGGGGMGKAAKPWEFKPPASMPKGRPVRANVEIPTTSGPGMVSPKIPKPSPPGILPEQVASAQLSLRARAIEKALPAVAAGAAESAAVGFSQATTRAAEKGRFDPTEVAAQVALSSAFGAATSLIGSGIGLGLTKAKSVALKKAGVDSKTLDGLHKRVSTLQDDLAAARGALGDKGHLLDSSMGTIKNGRFAPASVEAESIQKILGPAWLGKSRVPAYALASQLKAAKQGLTEARLKAAGSLGGTIQKARTALAVGGYISSESFLLGATMYGAASALRSRVGQRAALSAAGAGAKAVSAGRGIKGIIGPTISSSMMSDWSDQLRNTDASQVKQDIYSGLTGSGVEHDLADEISSFHVNRLQILRDNFPRRDTPEGRASFSRYLDALNTPKRIMKRLKSGLVLREDIDVLRIAFPKTYSAMVSEAQSRLSLKKLPAGQRRVLQKIIDYGASSQRHASMRKTMYPEGKPMGSAQPSTGQASSPFSTPTQKMSAGLGG